MNRLDIHLFRIVIIILFSIQNISCKRSTTFELESIRSSIFKIYVKSVEPRYDLPWLHESSTHSTGSGFYIGNGQILTNAHVVAHGKFITVQPDGSDQAFVAKIRFIAHDCDLAVLEVDAPEILKEIKELSLGGMPALRKMVSTVGYPKGGEQISVTDGVVSRISFRPYVHIAYDEHLLVQVDSAINSGNSGGPVFQGGNVVGVAFQSYTDAENTGYIIPTPVVQRFLKDIEDGHYDGHPHDGLITLPLSLENTGTRKFYGLADGEGGIKVSFVEKSSSLYSYIQPDDILLSINDYPIGVDGKIQLYGERLDFRIPFDLAQIGEHVRFKVLRNHERLDLEVKIGPTKTTYDPNNRFTEHPEFLIFGGLIFEELSRNYLRTWGRRWYYEAPIIHRFAHNYFHIDPRLQDREDVIILIDRLPDSANHDADPFQHRILDSLNGQTVNSLNQLNQFLRSEKSDFLVFEFLNGGPPLILDRERLLQNHQPILDRYQVNLERWLGDPLTEAGPERLETQ